MINGPYKSTWHAEYPEDQELADKLCDYADECIENGASEEEALAGIDKIEREHNE